MAEPSDAPRKLHPTVLDTSAVLIAHAYAHALYDAAENSNQLSAVFEEYESLVHDVLDRNPDFEQALRSMIVSRADKEALLRRLFEGRATPIFLNYLLVLNDHSRLELLRPAFIQLRSIRDRRLGRVPVEVRAAVPLDAAVEQALRNRLTKVITGEPVIHSQVDPALLGGLVIRVGDTVFDGSVRTRLRRIREQLLQRSTHEIQSRRDQFSLTT
ncbi:MAG: ATP synthase F1 subunit delta [Planctomycetes bacterium]|nr:ATP synthase F1 subunit delta [Planctomycetota bacterium]